MKNLKMIASALLAIGLVFGVLYGGAVWSEKLREQQRQADIQHERDLQVMASNLVRGMIEVQVNKALDKEVVRQLSRSTN